MARAAKTDAPYSLLPHHESPPLAIVPAPQCSPRAMAAHVMTFAPATDAEALKLLRASFQDAPLSLRVAALNVLMHKRRR